MVNAPVARARWACNRYSLPEASRPLRMSMGTMSPCRRRGRSARMASCSVTGPTAAPVAAASSSKASASSGLGWFMRSHQLTRSRPETQDRCVPMVMPQWSPSRPAFCRRWYSSQAASSATSPVSGATPAGPRPPAAPRGDGPPASATGLPRGGDSLATSPPAGATRSPNCKASTTSAGAPASAHARIESAPTMQTLPPQVRTAGTAVARAARRGEQSPAVTSTTSN
mmetsp:Transcript_25457/g.95949  ORF Transcript_25457/g.95949 Transcript_25457/m.95949 type:complete len:227 (-) Transcript_25457:120-800(-)